MEGFFDNLLPHWLDIHLKELYPEESLKRLLLQEDFKDLPSYTFPRIYRGLPREIDKRGQKQIFPAFQAKDRLKYHLIDKAILYLYDNIPFHIDRPLVIFTWVMAGGLGDFFAQKEIAEILKARFPKLPIKLVTIVHQLEQKKCISSFETIFCTFKNDEEMSIKLLSQKALDLLKSAYLIFQTPTYFPDTPKLLKMICTPGYEALGEYGFINSEDFSPSGNARCMGLHFLEKGIIIKKLTVPQELSHKKLLSFFTLEHHVHFAYLITKRGAFLFFFSILKLHENDEKPIDFFVTDLCLFFDFLKPHVPIEGVKEIKIYYHEFFHCETYGEKGKQIRFIHTGALSHEDFVFLLHKSTPPIVCRGDQSFSEVIALKKTFFYDAPSHAIPFLKDLLALCEHRIPELAPFISLFIPQADEPLEKIALKMGVFLKSACIEKCFHELCDILHKEYCANPIICQIISRKILHIQYPQLASLEKKLVDEFCLGRLTFKKLLNHLKDRLESI